ncbi:MAG: hypothetical protein ACUVV0_16090 [Anaerolineae bacterium]
MVILDTDVMIDLLRRYPPAVAWLESLGDEEIALPEFVVMELIQGCRDRAEQEHLESQLSPYIYYGLRQRHVTQPWLFLPNFTSVIAWAC